MADSDEDLERKRRDRDKFKRERESSDIIDLSESKRKHSSLSSNNAENFRQKHDNSQLFRSSKRFKRTPQDFQTLPFVWPFEVPSNVDFAKIEGSNISPTNMCSGVFLMSFKQFMSDQDDSIDEIEAVNRYNEYKRNISAQFIASYFEEHKSEQWFQEKYHPYIRDQIRIQKQISFSQRFNSFWFLYEQGLLAHITLDVENVTSIENLLDISLLLMDFSIISENQVNISEAHKKVIDKLNIFCSNDSIKPDTTTNLFAEDGDKKETAFGGVQISFQDILLPERCDPFSFSIISISGLPLFIQRERLESICKPFGKVIRIFFTDPTVLSSEFRNCSITFSDNLDVNSLISNLQSNFPKEEFPEISINLDTERVPRTKSSLSINNALDVVISNILLIVKVVKALDMKMNLFMKESWIRNQTHVTSIFSSLKVFSFQEENPLLLLVPSDVEINQIRSNLAAAEKAEEEEEGVIPSEVSFRRNVNLYKVLDVLILYLRMVHSFDFYSRTIIDFEDSMPSRLSELSIRGPPNISATVKDVSQHIADFSNSINTILDQNLSLPDEDMACLGKRTEDQCIENFIQENTKMIEAEKYLCPLSGKKFKGPEYVRKHIHNKHKDKIDEVKLEVQYFNCYLSDRNRPMPKLRGSNDYKFQKKSNKNESMLSLMGNQVFKSKDGSHTQNWAFHPNMLLPPHGPSFPHNMDYTRFPAYSHFGNRRNQNRKLDDNRKPISYKDWDDPNLDN